MAVNCEPMAEMQGSERNLGVSGDATRTIEFLRARLLSERAASRAARQEVQQIADKVAELQAQLDLERAQRMKAEAAAHKVLEVLRAKGLPSELDMLLSQGSHARQQQSIKTDSEFLEQIVEETTELLKSRRDETSKFLKQSPEEGSETKNGNGSKGALMDRDHISQNDNALEIFENGFPDPFPSNAVSKNPRCSDPNDIGGGTADQPEKGISTDAKEMQANQAADQKLVEERFKNLLCQLNREVESLSADEPLKIKLQSWVDGVENMLECEESANPCLTSNAKKLVHVNVSYHGNGQMEKIDNDPDPDVEKVVVTMCLQNEDIKGISDVPDLHTKVSMDGYGLARRRWQGSSDEGNPKSGIIDKSCPPSQPSSSSHQSYQFGTMCHSSDSHIIDDWSKFATPKMAKYQERDSPAHPCSSFHVSPHANFCMNNYVGERLPSFVNVQRSGAWAGRANMNGAYTHYTGCYHNGDALVYPDEISFNFNAQSSWCQKPFVSDAVLSLLDDKNGRLGDILMALNLAKQQVEVDSEDDQPMHSLENGIKNAIPDGFNKETLCMDRSMDCHFHQQHACRSGLSSKDPIVDLPSSPTSDKGFHAFEKQEDLRRSQSVSFDFMLRPYVQPRGKVHLGNGITLYTD